VDQIHPDADPRSGSTSSTGLTGLRGNPLIEAVEQCRSATGEHSVKPCCLLRQRQDGILEREECRRTFRRVSLIDRAHEVAQQTCQLGHVLLGIRLFVSARG
jgi:hypothetical protein